MHREDYTISLYCVVSDHDCAVRRDTATAAEIQPTLQCGEALKLDIRGAYIRLALLLSRFAMGFHLYWHYLLPTQEEGFS